MNQIPCSAAAILVALVVLLILGTRESAPFYRHWRDRWWRKEQAKRRVSDWRSGGAP